jgi:FAD/FMN-containing dehydrogenase
MDLEKQIQKIIAGEAHADDATREFYSHDASMFELVPQVVAYPKDVADVTKIVSFVAQNKKANPDLAITPRSAGTDMSGGAVGESIVLDFTKHFNQIGTITPTSAEVQPGVYYRDFEPKTLEFGAYMPSYPASRDLCTLGGMVSNNSGGEKSLSYGKTEDYVTELKVVLADGNEYTIKPLNKKQLVAKMSQGDFEGNIYKQIFELVENNYDVIKAAKPKVSKDSTGYHLWNIWDRDTGIFDLTQALIGAQGTLGIITNIKLKLVPKAKHSGVLVCFLKDITQLGDIINDVLANKPESFESFDDVTLKLSFKFFFSFRKTLGYKGLFELGWRLIPNALMLLRGVPRLILLIEFTGDTQEEVTQKIHAQKLALNKYKMAMEEDDSEEKSKKFWIMRRQSFNLLRSKVKDKHTAPFMDDLVVPPKYLPQFLPEIRKVIKKYKLFATIAGHMGDGNFHIIPLMKIEDPKEKAKLEPAMKEINTLILKYDGSLSGEHNDGMIRGPWLEAMYGPEMLKHFKTVKHTFDPQNIFNPRKKTDADWDYSMAHLREHF